MISNLCLSVEYIYFLLQKQNDFFNLSKNNDEIIL